MFKRISFILFGLVVTFFAHAAIDTYNFKSVEEEQQFRELTGQLRCPKCQNNSIADSNAPIATDMREKVYELMEQGQSRQDIINYMVARYGNFVTYEPPVTPATIFLWLVPVLCVVIGAGAIVMLSRRRKVSASWAEPETLSEQEKARLQQLLNDKTDAKGRKTS
ncbi:cytochrome c-type biogenesis protein [Limnobaculum parvum]|uniref:Cytochrome c-type biogenesis protein n=1 Tax=Limnobaculum parvum TaxID=2172103 RepID=A0A2Y9TVY0_9GAMM|nr:cytochrome c-type biogenesis protein [Limnobaculum parvum]AWH87865.1 cytochrome c-type biogenesis protein CcmH [Limnobaculum parvum]